MKKPLILLLLVASATTCFAQELKRNKTPKQDYDNKRVYHVTKNTSFVTSPAIVYTQLGFKPYAELLGELQRKRGLGIITDQELETKKAALPAGGILRIESRRKTIEQSDSKNFIIVIQDKSGKEVHRTTCPSAQGILISETLNLPKHYATMVDVPIDATLNGSEFNLYIIDDALGLKFEYIIKND